MDALALAHSASFFAATRRTECQPHVWSATAATRCLLAQLFHPTRAAFKVCLLYTSPSPRDTERS
eukprot:6337051-Karenia_brevis.AAC.1